MDITINGKGYNLTEEAVYVCEYGSGFSDVAVKHGFDNTALIVSNHVKR